jgi:hypothetical protein
MRGMAIIPKWSMNAGYMLAHQVMDGAEFWLNCSKCDRPRRKLNLPKIVLAENPLWSPWGRRPVCELCGGQQFINGHHSDKPGSMVYPLIVQRGDPEWHEVVEYHAVWRREQERLCPIKRTIRLGKSKGDWLPGDSHDKREPR